MRNQDREFPFISLVEYIPELRAAPSCSPQADECASTKEAVQLAPVHQGGKCE